MLMGLFGTLMGQPPNANVNADSGASSSSNAAMNEEYEQFMRNFSQGFQAGVNASSNFQAQSQFSAEDSQVPAVVSFLFGKTSGIMFVFSGTCRLSSVLSSIDRSWLAALSHRLLRHRIACSAARSVFLCCGDPGADSGAEQRSFVYWVDSDDFERDYSIEIGRLARHADGQSVFRSAEMVRVPDANGRTKRESRL